MATPPEPILDAETQRRVAGRLYNHVWDLLDAGDSRTAVQTAEMMDAAHASRWHWAQIGGAEQNVVGEWMVSRVYAASGLGGEAVRHAEASYALLLAASDLPDWVVASVHEGRARAYVAAGDLVAAAQAKALATESMAAIVEAEDRALIATQLAELPL